MASPGLGRHYPSAMNDQGWEPALLITAGQPPGGIDPPASLRQRVHRIPLSRLGLGEMPLSSDPVPARFHPLGVETAHRVVSGLQGRLCIREIELGLPVCSLGIRKLQLRRSQLTK
jgi:hypothetical protein